MTLIKGTDMDIWHEPILLDRLNHLSCNTIADYLGIKFIDYGDDYLSASMLMNKTTKQPGGILHGGASCVLAETVGSVAGNLVIDFGRYYCVGLDINANHLRPVSEGVVVAKASSLHLGKKTHVWNISIVDEKTQKMICIARLTLMILRR